MGVKEYLGSSENDQKRLKIDIFRRFLLFVISRSGVRIRLLSTSQSLTLDRDVVFSACQRRLTHNGPAKQAGCTGRLDTFRIVR